MDKQIIRRYLLAAILLVGLLPVLGYYGARLLPGAKLPGEWGALAFQTGGVKGIPLRTAVQSGSLFAAGAAGYLFCLLAAARLPLRKSWPFLALVPAGRLLRYFAPLLWSELFVRSDLVPLGQITVTDLELYMQPVPASVIAFAGFSAGFFLMGVYKKRMGENAAIVLTAATALGAVLLLGAGVKTVNTLCFADNTIWVGTFWQMIVWTPFQLAAAAAALLAGKEIAKQIKERKQED